MLIVIGGIALLGIVLGIFLQETLCDDTFGMVLTVLASIILVLAIGAAVVVGVKLSHALYIEDEIVLYETENAHIEQAIAETVSAYLAHETEVLGAAAPTAAMTADADTALVVIAAYPELRSVDIVSSQIQVYRANNERLRALKTEKLTLNMYRWWLYFGGRATSQTEGAAG